MESTPFVVSAETMMSMEAMELNPWHPGSTPGVGLFSYCIKI